MIAATLDLDPGYFPEYRLAQLRDQLSPKRVGFHAALRRYPNSLISSAGGSLVDRQQIHRLAAVLRTRSGVRGWSQAARD